MIKVTATDSIAVHPISEIDGKVEGTLVVRY
jgi:hypothetical protein